MALQLSVARYREIKIAASGLNLHINFVLENDSRAVSKPETLSIGWQFYDPETSRFIMEGEWLPIGRPAKPGESVQVDLAVPFPPEPGDYRVYVSPIAPEAGWAYQQGQAFLAVDVAVAEQRVEVIKHELTTSRALRIRSLWRALPALFYEPATVIVRNRSLIRSMVRRDILARYRGSFGDVFWTILNPLILMATYFFVFGVVLHTRAAPGQSSADFALYFLAGMLPWLAFSEAAGRAPYVIVEHRNFVKKLIFPIETLPVNYVVSGLITEGFAIALFLGILLALRHALPATVLWLPVLLAPQILFTLGICWFLAALGVFFRDLGQIMGFLLTLWFFITPICYPEASLSPATLSILRKNPIFVLVHGYRAVLLHGQAPEQAPLLKLWLLAAVVWLLGYAWFYKLRKSFPDVI